jgi:hypothetical protein
MTDQYHRATKFRRTFSGPETQKNEHLNIFQRDSDMANISLNGVTEKDLVNFAAQPDLAILKCAAWQWLTFERELLERLGAPIPGFGIQPIVRAAE